MRHIPYPFKCHSLIQGQDPGPQSECFIEGWELNCEYISPDHEPTEGEKKEWAVIEGQEGGRGQKGWQGGGQCSNKARPELY